MSQTTSATEQVSESQTPPSSPIQPPVPGSPKWETPKAHQRAQKQRIERAAKAAKEARMAARAEEAKMAAKARARAHQPSGARPCIPLEELCHHCPIHAPHRVGMYKHDSSELPKKILIIQGKILQGTATNEDLILRNAFAAVHTNYTYVPVPKTAATNQPNRENTTAQPAGPKRNRGRRSQNRDCRDPSCPIKAPHRRGRVNVDSRNVPWKIQIITGRVANDRATWEEYQLLRDFNAVHNPELEVEGEVKVKVDEEVEIIC